MDISSLMGRFKGFVNNPMAFLMQNRLNIPQEYMNDPQGAIQYLLNTGKLTQEQYNQAVVQARQLQSNPQFMEMLKSIKQ